MSKLSSTILAVGALVVAVGCGDDGDSSGTKDQSAQAKAVRAVVDVANSSFVDGDYARTCRQYTARALREVMATVSATTCEQAWERIAAAMRASMTAAEIRATTTYGVDTVRVDGNTATARYGDPPEAIRDQPGIKAGAEVRLLRLDGVWRIDSFPGE